jgi:hypothetical protein
LKTKKPGHAAKVLYFRKCTGLVFGELLEYKTLLLSSSIMMGSASTVIVFGELL